MRRIDGSSELNDFENPSLTNRRRIPTCDTGGFWSTTKLKNIRFSTLFYFNSLFACRAQPAETGIWNTDVCLEMASHWCIVSCNSDFLFCKKDSLDHSAFKKAPFVPKMQYAKNRNIKHWRVLKSGQIYNTEPETLRRVRKLLQTDALSQFEIRDVLTSNQSKWLQFKWLMRSYI